MANRFEQAYIGDQPLPKEPQIEGAENPFAKHATGTPAANPFEKYNEATSEPAVGDSVPVAAEANPFVKHAPVEAHVKSVIAGMPQYREDFLGRPVQINAPAPDTGVKANQYMDKVSGTVLDPKTPINDTILGPPKSVRPAVDAAEEQKRLHNWSFNNPFDYLKNGDWDNFARAATARTKTHMQGEQAIGEAFSSHVSKSNPLNVAAKYSIGKALETGQEWFGLPIASAIVKDAMLPRPDYGVAGSQGWASLTPEQREEQYLKQLNPEQKEFYLRHKGSYAYELKQPGKYVIPGTKETALREFWSWLGSDALKIQGPKHEEAWKNAVPWEVGGVEIAPIVASVTDMAGQAIPYTMFSVTGVGARATAGELAKFEELRKAGRMTAAEQVSAVNKANRLGMTKEFAAQDAIAESKEGGDLQTGVMRGSLMGHVFGFFEPLVTANHGAKKYLLGGVNEARKKGAAEVAEHLATKDFNSKLKDEKAWKSLILPQLTWKQFVKENDEFVKRPVQGAGPAVRKFSGIDTKNASPGSVIGDAKRDYTYRTVEYGRDGELREVRYLSNAKTGKAMPVYSAPMTKAQIRGTQGYVATMEQTDLAAYLDMLEVYRTGDARFGKDRALEQHKMDIGKAGYASPEHIAAQYPGRTMAETQEAFSKVARANNPDMPQEGLPTRNVKSPAVTPPPEMASPITKVQGRPINELPVGAAVKNEAPVVLTVKKNGDIVATPTVDRSGLTDTAITPKRGDVVHVGSDDTLGVVESVSRDGQATVNIKGQSHTVNRAEVTLAREDLIDLKHLLGERDFNAVPQFEREKIGKNLFSEVKKRDNLLKLKELDIKRVMNATGIENPAEAKALLDDMVKAGQLKPEVAGRWEVEKSYKPEHAERLEGQGYRVYYNTSKDGDGLSGILRGRDPKRYNNVLIEVGTEELHPPQLASQSQTQRAQQYGLSPYEIFSQTKLISIPESQVRTYHPVFGNASKSKLPDQFGITVPMPPDVMVLNSKAAKAMAQYTRMEGQLNKLLSPIEAIKKGLQKTFVHDAFLVPTDIRQKATQLAAEKSVVKADAERMQNYLMGRLGGMSVEDTWLADIMKRRASKAGRGLSDQEKGLMRFFSNNPQLAGEVEQSIRTALAQLKTNQEIMVQLGITNIGELEALRAMGLEEEYATNIYLKHMMQRKDFAKFAQEQFPEKWNKAVELIARRNPNQAFQNVEKDMLDLLGVDEVKMANEIKTEPQGAAQKKLRERLKLSREIKDIMGNLDSASIQIAHSLAASDSIIRRVKTWNELQATPYWSPGPRNDLGSKGGIHVPDLPIYGNARRGYIHESMRFLIEAPPAHVEASGMLRSLASVWKFNQVVGGGFTPWVNQVMRNWKGLYVSGGLQSLDDFHTFFDSAREMLEYRANPIKNRGTFYDALMKNGGIGTGFAGSEISKNKAVNRILQAIKQANGKHEDIWGLLSDIGPQIKGTAEEVGAAYDAIDRLFKLTAAKNNYRRFLAGGMPADDAMALTVMRNNQSFVNFDLVSPMTEKWRQSGVSAAAPFVSSKMEDLRINATTIMRLKDEPDLAARMVVMTGVIAAMVGLMREQRRANGISDERARIALDSQPLGQQAFHPMGFIGPQLDSEGRMQVYDPTPYEDLLIMMQMHERDNPLGALVRNNLTGVFGEDSLGGQMIDSAFTGAGATVPLGQVMQMVEKPGQQSMMQILSFIAANGGLPNAPFKGYKQWKATQPADTVYGGVYKEQLTPDQGRAKFFGYPMVGPVGSRTETARAKEFERSAGEMEKQLYNTFAGQPEENWEEQKNAKLKALMEMVNEFQESKK
jgi:hypothetical protein